MKKTTKKKRNRKQNRSKHTFSFSEFWFFVLFLASLSVVVAVPLLCYIIFSTGNYLGSTLSVIGLTTSEDIRIKNTLVDGKLVAEDNKYLYISTTSRTLLEVSKDASIQITKPNELMTFRVSQRIGVLMSAYFIEIIHYGIAALLEKQILVIP